MFFPTERCLVLLVLIGANSMPQVEASETGTHDTNPKPCWPEQPSAKPALVSCGATPAARADPMAEEMRTTDRIDKANYPWRKTFTPEEEAQQNAERGRRKLEHSRRRAQRWHTAPTTTALSEGWPRYSMTDQQWRARDGPALQAAKREEYLQKKAAIRSGQQFTPEEEAQQNAARARRKLEHNRQLLGLVVLPHHRLVG